jgi:hypothetical protein
VAADRDFTKNSGLAWDYLWNERLRPAFPWWIVILCILTLASRVVYISGPYFVDGPRHVEAIMSGTIFISPPGYFLFAESAKAISLALNVSVPSAIAILNIFFSISGVAIFADLARRFFPGMLGVTLAFCYAFSVIVWFAADIHSTYAAMTFFAPALLHTIWIEESGWAAGLLWAAMTGFRPSDGVFVLPFVIFMTGRRGARQIVSFASAALPVIALWYIPTARHFGGVLSPLHSAGAQAHGLANGLFINVPWKRKFGNLIHVAFGGFNAWNILTPFVFVGCFSKSTWSRSALIYVVPGVLFFSLYFFSDAAYFAYLVAPGLLLAGEGLQLMRLKNAVIIAALAVLISIGQMMLVRPISSRSVASAVINAYCLQYSGWAIQHHYNPRLRDTLEAAEPAIKP